jgi:hypothetical protein
MVLGEIFLLAITFFLTKQLIFSYKDIYMEYSGFKWLKVDQMWGQGARKG